MLSEEEMKTIEILKTFIKTKIDYCKLKKTDVTDILKLIKKQDNKIKFLLDDKKSLKEMNRNQMKIIEIQQKTVNQLLEDMKERANNFSYESEIMWRKIEKSEELLEENNAKKMF